MTEDTIVQRCGDLIEAKVDGELVALHVEKGNCYGFNSTATHVWGLLDRPKRISELRDELVAEYDVDPATCEKQLIDLLRDLEQDELVEMKRAPAE